MHNTTSPLARPQHNFGSEQTSRCNRASQTHTHANGKGLPHTASLYPTTTTMKIKTGHNQILDVSERPTKQTDSVFTIFTRETDIGFQ